MNNLEETDRIYLIMRRKEEARYLREYKKKLWKGIRLNVRKTYRFLQRIIDTWNGLKEVVIMAKNTTTEWQNSTNIDTETGPHECSSGPVYYN